MARAQKRQKSARLLGHSGDSRSGNVGGERRNSPAAGTLMTGRRSAGDNDLDRGSPS